MNAPAPRTARPSGRGVTAALLLLAWGVPATLSAQGAPAAHVVDTERFTLRSDARVSLHHFLAAWAAAEAGAWPGYAEPVFERTQPLALSAAERNVWDAAVAAYAAAVGRNMVFDEGLIAVRDWAAGVTPLARIDAADRPLAAAVERALPVYLRRWWPAHDARNRAWIDAVAPTLRETEADIAARIAAAYGGRWPAQRIPVDLVAYANDVGAYSTGGRVILASADPAIRFPQSLELLFHEASHVDPLETPLRAAIDAAFAAEGGRAPDRLWHDVIFFTAGEATAAALEAAGRPGYRHYGETAGVYARGERWRTQLPALERHWRPWLRADAPAAAERTAALRAVARALLHR